MISEFAKEKVFWTRKMNLKLVKFIESRPNIWNPKHQKYTSVEVRDQTYSEFASKYGNEFTGQAVKDRWTNIRSTFANYLRKLNASRAKGDGEEYKVNWHLWEACQFLLKVNRRIKAETSNSEHFHDGEKDDNHRIGRSWSSEDENLLQNDDSNDSNNSNSQCKTIADSLLEVFKGVQNDAFGIDNTRHGRVGRTVTRKLSLMSSYDVAQASMKIMEVLLLYDQNNPMNPNNLKSDCV